VVARVQGDYGLLEPESGRKERGRKKMAEKTLSGIVRFK